MGLVGYSDSDNSDAEQSFRTPKPAQQKPEHTPSTKNKLLFQTVVDHAELRKIKVPLPQATRKDIEEDGTAVDEDARPAKRARTSGASGGFNALLPAPKNRGINRAGIFNGNNSGDQRPRGAGLGRGVSLRTGAAPAFSRSSDQTDQVAASPVERSTDHGHPPESGTKANVDFLAQRKPEEEPKLIGKPMMFKPLSVARKPQKKRRILDETRIAAATTAQQGGNTMHHEQDITSEQQQQKPKVSLFSAAIEGPVKAPTSGGSNEEYEPLLDIEPLPEDLQHSRPEEHQEIPNSASHNQATSQTNNLGDLADNLGLTPAQKRQLFGRGGHPTDAQIAQFSLAAEYAHNREQIENQTTAPTNNPVKSIAPGKHSLQQLVNAATSQKDALEESFAQGKRNKRDAGSKYGF